MLAWEQKNVDAIMNVWFGGSEAADAICDVLFGDKAPSGRLTMTMPQSTDSFPFITTTSARGVPFVRVP